MASASPVIAVVIPCYNEEASVADVVRGFKSNLPGCLVHVFDNNSSDRTAVYAKQAGAVVHYVKRKGKGHVIRAMFRDVDADYYVMVDGDGTYPEEAAPAMVEHAVRHQADMVIGNRMMSYGESASRRGHLVGNVLLTRAVNYLFSSDIQDLLSGYRVFSRRFVKSIPLFTTGFEVETSMAIHAVEVDAKVVEHDIDYRQRAEGTSSKLNTISDGFKIAWTIFRLFKDYRPTFVYGAVGFVILAMSLALGIPVVLEYMETGLVPRFPTAILASALGVIGILTCFTGIIISSISKSRREIKKLAFLK